jgi:DNA-binding transcriptional LysR family regulator
MNLEQLEILLDLVCTHSFNQTAERLFTTQQTVSYHMKRLENELGVEIFSRSRRGVEFSPEGKIVLVFARDTVAGHETMKARLRDSQGVTAEKPQIRLNVASVLLASRLPRILEAFHQLISGVVRLKEIEHEAVLPTMAEGRCDIAVWSINRQYFEQNIPCYSERFEYELIKTDRPVAVVAANSPLASKAILSRKDMTTHAKSAFGLLPFDSANKPRNAFAVYEDDNPQIHKQMILDSSAICFMGEDTFKSLFRGGLFVAKEFDYPVEPLCHLLLYNKGARTAVCDQLAALIRNSFA